jgi:hypothetical protein
VLILGKPQTGKSNSLRVILVEAYISGRFAVVPLDPSNKNNFFKTWNQVIDEHLIGTDLDSAIRNLTMIRSIMESRLAGQAEALPSILVAIDDADVVLQHALGARLVGDILERGGKAGVGLVRQHPFGL